MVKLCSYFNLLILFLSEMSNSLLGEIWPSAATAQTKRCLSQNIFQPLDIALRFYLKYYYQVKFVKRMIEKKLLELKFFFRKPTKKLNLYARN